MKTRYLQLKAHGNIFDFFNPCSHFPLVILIV